jgi:hypothetical protein
VISEYTDAGSAEADDEEVAAFTESPVVADLAVTVVESEAAFTTGRKGVGELGRAENVGIFGGK